MTWPPADLPIDFENATPQENTHPDAHNATNQTINADLVPEISRVGALADTIGLYLPLAGGTLTGPVQTSGLDAKANGSSSPTNPNITFGTSGVNAQTGFYRNSTGAIQVACEGTAVARFGKAHATLYNDLKVDGTVQTGKGNQTSPAVAFGGTSSGLYLTSPANAVATTVNGAYRHIVYEDRTRVAGDLQVDGQTKAQNGTKSAPAYSFASETETGMYRPESKALELMVGGERAVYFGKSTNSSHGVYMPLLNARPAPPAAYPAVMVLDNSEGGMMVRATSARRHLKNIEAVNLDATNSVYDLKPVWYRSKTNNAPDGHSHYGFVADDVAAIDPRLVTYSTDDEGQKRPETVNDHAVIALLVSAVQEQRATISDLTARVEALENA